MAPTIELRISCRDIVAMWPPAGGGWSERDRKHGVLLSFWKKFVNANFFS
jgi:hypothetical protein